MAVTQTNYQTATIVVDSKNLLASLGLPANATIVEVSWSGTQLNVIAQLQIGNPVITSP